jgi:hypothetical protein
VRKDADSAEGIGDSDAGGHDKFFAIADEKYHNIIHCQVTYALAVICIVKMPELSLVNLFQVPVMVAVPVHCCDFAHHQ